MNESAKKVNSYLEESIPQPKSTHGFCQRHGKVYQELDGDLWVCEQCLLETIHPIEDKNDEGWCEEHDQPLKVLWKGEAPICEACLLFQTSGFAYYCSSHDESYNDFCKACRHEDDEYEAWRLVDYGL